MTRQRSWSVEDAAEIVARHRGRPGATLPMLHALQDAFGYIDRAAVPLIAEALNLSEAEIHGVISFYHDFRDQPAGRHVLKVCRAEACQSMGSDRLVEHLESRHGMEMGKTNASRRLTVEPVYCLGNCACSPSVMLDGRLHGRVDTASLDRLVETAEHP